MVNWNNVRKFFVLLALVTLPTACSSFTLEATPTVRQRDPLPLL